MPKYATIAGTEPSEDTQHEARTMTRIDTDGAVFMMTEIEDGLFVQWSQCAKCHEHMTSCSCVGGPQMPKYMAEWRDKRFKNSLKGRKSPKSVVEMEVEAEEDPHDDDGNRETPEWQVPDVDDERDHEETGPDGDARTYDPETGEKIEPIIPDTRQNVDDGLDKAKAAVEAAKNERDNTDVGF